MYLFLDDIRSPEDARVVLHSENAVAILRNHNYEIVRNYQQFTSWIEENGLPALISFDNDLGEQDDKTGYDCAQWLVYYCLKRKIGLPEWSIHSANPVGVKNIQMLLISYAKHIANAPLSFQENSEVGKAILKFQSPVTFEKAKFQAKWLKENSMSRNKKKRFE